MVKYVAFLRAVNVGGHGRVKMQDLIRAFEEAGCRSVRTYIQSGNVIYEAPDDAHAALSAAVHASLRRLLGEQTVVVTRTLPHLEALVEANPFRGVDPGSDVKLYVAFLARAPQVQLRFPVEDPRESLRMLELDANDVFIVSGRKKNGFYGFPNNVIEKELGVPATARNWATVTGIVGKFC